MNVLLKAIIKEAFDAETLIVDALAKSWAKMLGDALVAGQDVPAIISNFSDAGAELQALVANPAADADLLAYVTGLAGGLADAKAKAIIGAASKLALDNLQGIAALVAAIKA